VACSNNYIVLDFWYVVVRLWAFIWCIIYYYCNLFWVTPHLSTDLRDYKFSRRCRQRQAWCNFNSTLRNSYLFTLIKVRAHLNRRHTHNFTSYRPSKSHYRVEKYTEIPDIIYTQMQHLAGGKVRKGKCFTQTGRGDVRRGKCPTPRKSSWVSCLARMFTAWCTGKGV